ncbi:MAG: ATP phosphoribosyltransferase regulatory subunit [Alphaproteobacteria bacterium]|nr:ATP phosphoribosyltransferase regulatory subunit [Alphaproteobacteria bacterium]
MTDEIENKALLPAGLHDLLPPLAAQESSTIAVIMDVFGSCGYLQVKPPIIEFESTLAGIDANGGGSLAGQMFRLMDPVSQRMMGVRADITLQVARIAGTRLVDEVRPLRLSYAGQVLRVRGNQMRPERQFAQVGVELIGPDDVNADIEVVTLAAEALRAAGVSEPTIDINSPALVANILEDIELGGRDIADLRSSLDRKDSDATKEIFRQNGLLFTDSAKALCAMIETFGPAKGVIEELQSIDLPAGARAEVERLAAVVEGICTALPDLSLTLDPVEYRGFEYQTGVSFTVFAEGVRGELARGGRYITEFGESATGVSLYMDSVLRALPDTELGKLLYLPLGTSFSSGRAFRGDGWSTVAGLQDVHDNETEARRLGCSHALVDEKPVAIGDLSN